MHVPGTGTDLPAAARLLRASERTRQRASLLPGDVHVGAKGRADESGWAMAELADLEGLLAAAAGFAHSVGGADGASPAEGGAAELLLGVNVLTSSAVDADNLQKVLTFLVSSVQSIAASCASSEACHAATEDKLAATTGELAGLREKFDTLASQVDSLTNDKSAAEDTASLQAALNASEDRMGAQLQEMEERLSAEAQKSRRELEATLESAMVAANEKLSEARSTIEAQSKEAAAATASVTERLAATETETAGHLGELQTLVDSARADLQGEIRDLRDFIRTGLQAAAEGKEVPTELPNSDALAAETVMKYGIFICYCLACVLVTVLVTVADRFRKYVLLCQGSTRGSGSGVCIAERAACRYPDEAGIA